MYAAITNDMSTDMYSKFSDIFSNGCSGNDNVAPQNADFIKAIKGRFSDNPAKAKYVPD